MKKVATLTERELDGEIAKGLGFEEHENSGLFYTDATKGWVKEPNRYSTDLNAIHEVEKHLTYIQTRKYSMYLLQYAKMNPNWLTIQADARQRAEALLLTLREDHDQ